MLPGKFADEAQFLRAWVENPGKTGAVSPSGRFLARKMARYVDPSLPGPVIELGPGTGPVTQALVERGVATERLVLIEYDPKFCTLLKDRFPGATVIEGDAYDLKSTLAGYDLSPAAAIVSSLPLLNKREVERASMLRTAFELLDQHGLVVQFTYGMVSPIPRKLKNGEIVKFVSEASPPVWLNIPPARVWTYRPAGDVLPLAGTGGREPLLGLLRESTSRVRDEILERRDRIETEWRLARERMRIGFELRATHIRRDKFEPSFDRHMRPALSLIKRMKDNRRRF